MTIKHPITGERTGYFDENATALKVGDTVELFGQNGTVNLRWYHFPERCALGSHQGQGMAAL